MLRWPAEWAAFEGDIRHASTIPIPFPEELLPSAVLTLDGEWLDREPSYYEVAPAMLADPIVRQWVDERVDAEILKGRAELRRWWPSSRGARLGMPIPPKYLTDEIVEGDRDAARVRLEHQHPLVIAAMEAGRRDKLAHMRRVLDENRDCFIIVVDTHR